MKRKQEESGGVNLGIIITPMLDMSFQILAFFIMTYHPSALEGHFDFKTLPPKTASKDAKAPASMEIPGATDDEPDLQDVLQVIIKSVAKGQKEGSRLEGEPSRILMAQKQDAAPVIVADSDVTWEEGLKKLETELNKFRKDSDNESAKINIQPDGELKHQYAMAVYDVCWRANFKSVQFIGPSVERKKEKE